VSLDHWILALHVLSAFAVVSAIVLFWVLIVAVRRTDSPDVTAGMAPVAKVGSISIGVGMGGTIVFGIWLALSFGNYDLWDGWIIAALVLWFAAAEFGRRAGAEYTRGMERAVELQAAGQTGPNAELAALNRTQHGLLMHGLSSIAVLLILVDMIWKPGA
jgi:hypothetical protein